MVRPEQTQAEPQPPARQRDLSDIAGSWEENPEFDQTIAEQDQVEEHLWR